MFCRECGQELSPVARFCKRCGSRVDHYNNAGALPVIDVESESPVESSSVITKGFRKSNREFDFLKYRNEFHLVYEYHNIPIEADADPKVDYASLPIEFEVSLKKRESDSDGYCRVQYLDLDTMKFIVLGHISNKSLNNMIPKYDADFDNMRIEAFIDQISDIDNTATIAIGFYRKLTKEEYERIRYIETKLIRTTITEEYTTPRQVIISQAYVDSPVELEYDYSSDTYIVSNSCFEEMGEINRSDSFKLREAELAGDTFHALIFSIDENVAGNLDCTIRVIFDKRFPPIGGYIDPKMED